MVDHDEAEDVTPFEAEEIEALDSMPLAGVEAYEDELAGGVECVDPAIMDRYRHLRSAA